MLNKSGREILQNTIYRTLKDHRRSRPTVKGEPDSIIFASEVTGCPLQVVERSTSPRLLCVSTAETIVNRAHYKENNRPIVYTIICAS